MKMTEIIHTNNVLRAAIAKGQPMHVIMVRLRCVCSSPAIGTVASGAWC